MLVLKYNKNVKKIVNALWSLEYNKKWNFTKRKTRINKKVKKIK